MDIREFAFRKAQSETDTILTGCEIQTITKEYHDVTTSDQWIEEPHDVDAPEGAVAVGRTYGPNHEYNNSDHGLKARVLAYARGEGDITTEELTKYRERLYPTKLKEYHDVVILDQTRLPRSDGAKERMRAVSDAIGKRFDDAIFHQLIKEVT